MLPFATATGATVAGGTAAAAGTAATAGTALLGALAGVSGIASGLASIARGNAEASSLIGQAEFEEFNAKQELLKGRSHALTAMRAANDAVASVQVAGFASGLTGAGSVATAKREAFEEGDFQVDMARSNAAIEAGIRRGTAASLRRDVGWARFSGWAEGVGQFAQTAMRAMGTG